MPALRAFFFFTKDISQSLAQQIVHEMGSRRGKNTTPVRIMELKTALLAQSEVVFDYPSLIKSLNYGCDRLALWHNLHKPSPIAAENHRRIVDHVAKEAKNILKEDHSVEETEAYMERMQVRRYLQNYSWPTSELTKTTYSGFCLNGFRGLLARDFPDSEKFEIVERELAIVCKCDDCESSLLKDFESRKREHKAIIG